MVQVLFNQIGKFVTFATFTLILLDSVKRVKKMKSCAVKDEERLFSEVVMLSIFLGWKDKSMEGWKRAIPEVVV